jgi:hypothetical protein
MKPAEQQQRGGFLPKIKTRHGGMAGFTGIQRFYLPVYIHFHTFAIVIKLQ